MLVAVLDNSMGNGFMFISLIGRNVWNGFLSGVCKVEKNWIGFVWVLQVLNFERYKCDGIKTWMCGGNFEFEWMLSCYVYVGDVNLIYGCLL